MRRFSLVFLLLAVPVMPASAANVGFIGNIDPGCTIAVPTPGILGIDEEGRLSSDAPLPAIPATVTIISIGANEISVTPPAWSGTPPAGYTAASEAFEVSYSGLTGLNAVDQPWTNQETDFDVGTLPLSEIAVHARVSNGNGFVNGVYNMQVVVTCS